jgi:DNA-binding response OmpR family regulator
VTTDGAPLELIVASRDARRGRRIASTLEAAGWAVRLALEGDVVDTVLSAASTDVAVVDITGTTRHGRPGATLGPLRIDRVRREVHVAGHDVAATRIEYALLEQLCDEPGQVRSRHDLGRAVWGRQWTGDPHVVDVHLSNLRRKLQRFAPGVQFIHTARGVGFRLSNDLLSA